MTLYHRRLLAAFALVLVLSCFLSPTAGGGRATAQVSTPTGGSTVVWSKGYTVVQHPLPRGGSQPWAIATDPSGRVWFVEQRSNQLGEYDPATGAMSQYSIPTPNSSADAVAADSRGNVWFTELASNKLGELRAGGSDVREFAIPGVQVNLAGLAQSLACGPSVVLPDPSGSVWVACIFSNQIVEFFPTNGTFARFELPVFQSSPAGMVLDGRGTLWFTAADAQMLGKAEVSQLRNNTSDGITEFAPLNQTYPFKFTLATSFLGSTTVITSSLPTPSGIAMDSQGRLWVTEHVDNSFDSYDIATGSLVRYWTSQTFGANGFRVSFPNGIAVDADGSVWVGEHYGNKIAEFVPSTGQMTEYPVPCCASSIAGVYSVALDRGGRLWFVEINGNAIGEMVPSSDLPGLSLSLPVSSVQLGPQGAATIPVDFGLETGSRNSTSISLSVSGISASGALENATARFGDSTLTLAPGAQASTNLTLSLQGLSQGTYYISLDARASPGGVVYASILRLTVTGGEPYPMDLILAVALVVAAAFGAAGWVLARRSRKPAGRRRLRSARYSLRSAISKTASPAPIAK